MTNDDIAKILTICDAATKGPATHAHGVDMDREAAVAHFVAHLDLAAAATGTHAIHVVDVAHPNDGSLCVAVTGNGPTSAANAVFIATAMDPEYGYAATLREVQRLRAEIEHDRARRNGMPASGRKA